MSIFTKDPVIYTGAPEPKGRSEKEMAVYALLDQLDIKYDRIDHKPVMSAQNCAEIEDLFQAPVCKNLFLCNRSMSQFYMLTMPNEKRFCSSKTSGLLHSSRLSFADTAHMQQFLNTSPGAVSILGLMFDTQNRVQLAIDTQLLQSEYIGCHPCVNTTSLKIRVADLLKTFLPFVEHSYLPILL